MGKMRFVVPQRERVPDHSLQRAYLAGIEYIPWLSRCYWQDDLLVAKRDVNDSCNLYIPWNVSDYGELVLSTTSLMEREQPYNLPVELARGTINRLRNQLAQWEAAGFKATDELIACVRTATEQFVVAATSQGDSATAAEKADEAITHALAAIKMLGRAYTQQVLDLQHQQSEKLPTLLGSSVGTTPLAKGKAEAFLSAFNTAVIPLSWRDVEPEEGTFQWDAVDAQLEWCKEAGLRRCSGPLLRIDKGNLPDWIYLWEEDFESLESYFLRYLRQVVNRYGGQLQIWQVAAGMNVDGAMALSEQDKLRLTVAAIETVRQADSKTPIVVTFDQPWAEYLAVRDLDLSPVHFADYLVRADLGVAGIGLEINFGYWPGGTLPREAIEISRQIDYWHTILGLPLLIMLTIPSSDEKD
ncbi:MAG: endo-1,4-beta-xylanase, partial [Planctomycetes bacterium]|nr:endo-1,4-beta-xylanase [Planctomycetota bacterium]